MSRLIEFISGRVIAPGSANFVPLIANGTDSFTVRDFDVATAKAYLVAVLGGNNNAGGLLRIRSPFFHDPNGLFYGDLNGAVRLIGYPHKIHPELYPGDILQVDAKGSSAGGDVWSLVIYYTNARGFKARYLDLDFIRKYKKRVFSVGTPSLMTYTGNAQFQIPPAGQLSALMTFIEYDRYYVLLGSGGTTLTSTFGGIQAPEWGNVNYPLNPAFDFPFTIWPDFLSEQIGEGAYPFFHSESINSIVSTFASPNNPGNFYLTYSLVELTQEANPIIEAMAESMGSDIVTAPSRSINQ